MSPLLITHAEIYAPNQVIQDGWLLAVGKKIQAMGSRTPPGTGADVEVIDAHGARLLPGLIDLHAHGGMGYEVMDASQTGLRNLAQFYASHGVTGFLATTWTAMPENTLRALQCVAENLGPQPGGASILGAHMEGPFFNPVRAGAQDAELIRQPTPGEMQPYFDLNVVRLVALAPEMPGCLWLVDECARRGITTSAGHTDATYEQIVEAVDHGLRQTTHTYNAMSLLMHRFPGVLGAVLEIPELRAELIADNVHVHPASMKILYQAKGPDGVILITDAVRGAGMPDGEYPIDHRKLIIKNGSARLPDGSLAGSVLTLERGLKNFQDACSRPLSELWVCSSQTAARAIGLDHHKGALNLGNDADLVLLDEEYRVVLTIVEGKVVYKT